VKLKSLTLKEIKELKVFENRMMRGTFKSKREEAIDRSTVTS
jgi:hypothetical protein